MNVKQKGKNKTMQKIIFLKGLPGSGKSTWAKQFCLDNPEYVRINKDDLRELLGNPTFSREFESEVLFIQRKMGESILATGKSLIVDDTNFSKKHQDYWLGVSNRLQLEFTVKTFDTPLEECISRDLAREKSVGKDVIFDMYEKYIKPNELKNTQSNYYE